MAFEGNTVFGVTVTYAKVGKMPFDFDRCGRLYFGGDPTVVPLVHESADIDGDGFGDAVLGLQNTVLGRHGGMTQPAILPINPGQPGATSRAALGGFDANGDGLSDIRSPFNDSFTPNARAFVAAGDHQAEFGASLTAGDLEGDGGWFAWASTERRRPPPSACRAWASASRPSGRVARARLAGPPWPPTAAG